MHITGTVDEAQAAMGLARAEAIPGSELDELLTRLERDLYVLMAEATTDPANRAKLKPGSTLVTDEMVAALEVHIDDFIDRIEMPTEFRDPWGQPDFGRPRPGPDGGAAGRAAGRGGLGRGLPGQDVPQPAFRPAVGHGPMDRG